MRNSLILALILSATFAIAAGVPLAARTGAGSTPAGTTEPPALFPELEALLAAAGPDEFVDVIVHTRLQADLADLPPHAGYDEKIGYLQSTAERAQRDILAWLATTDARNVRGFWLVSRIALSATPHVIRTLTERDDVAYIFDDFIVTVDYRPAEGDPLPPVDLQEWNISKVRAPECWSAGFNGAGIVVGNIDTGVSTSHPAFEGRWRSTNGWHDAVNGQGSPYDDNGHGTHCMGSAVGGNGIGVAPGATFIAAKALSASGSGNSSWFVACFDWMAGTGRPDVLSNSWGSDRNTTFWFSYVNNLRDLGIVVVGAVGNDGPGGSTSMPPGSYPNVIGVGATTSTDAVAYFSSRGPAPDQSPWYNSTWWPRPDWNLINPGVSAPGQNIRSAVPGGGYYSLDGTSMAAPHVAGAAAILLQKDRTLTHNQLFNLFADHAARPSGGAPYPNNSYGWGRLDVKASLDNVGGGGGGEETLRVHYTYEQNAVGLEEGGTFFSAARLAPARDCEVVAGIFLQHEASQNERYFVWRGNNATSPGAVVESIPYTGAGTGWKRVDLSQPFRVGAGQDVWLGPRFTHAAGQFPGGVDAGPAVPQRGGWVNLDGTWEELRNYGLAFNWMIAALVRYTGSVEEELLEPAPVAPQISAPTVLPGPGRVEFSLPAPGRVDLGVHDATGRLVRTLARGAMPAGRHTATWNRTDDHGRPVASGTYFYRLTVEGTTLAAKAVVLN